ncbi:hypothetical protein FB451DRAFT_1570557 [Mycena latifolia]|nr:hypothetical protein FB451DRAFT_1570557 [Mycena latifolia]
MCSPFLSKLGTNYCPKDKEFAEIQIFLAEPTLRLKLLDDKIADLQEALHKLADERSALSAYVDAHRALISPARRLPFDIIQEIFFACLPSHRNCVMSAAEAPVLLGRICSSWRAISLSTPRLWSRVHVVEPSCPPNDVALFEEKLVQRRETTTAWLNRSGHCPLSISLQCTCDSTTGPTSVGQNCVIQALLPFASRWEHITLASGLAAMVHLTEADVPMLKSVNIPSAQGYGGDTFRWDSLGFLRGPAISSFAIHSVYRAGSSFIPLELPVRWNRLTDLSITGVAGGCEANPSATFLEVFTQCPQLRTCRLVIYDSLDRSSPGGEHILQLSFLHTLEIKCRTRSSTIRHLFSRVSLPRLRNLKLRGSFDPDMAARESYAPLLAAAPCLKSLDVNIELFSKPSLAYFLRGLPPTLREIDISDSVTVGGQVFDDEILESLIPSADFPIPCCPGLLALEINYPCSLSDEALLRFIKSRTLKRVVTCFDRPMELDIGSELQLLVQRGLHLELTYPPPEVYRFSPWEGLEDKPDLTEAS